MAAAHAGWRGLAAGVIEATVRAMGVPPASLVAWLGPAIGPEHFEVGAEVRDAFLAGDPEAGEAFEPNARGRFMADLRMLARQAIARAWGEPHLWRRTNAPLLRPIATTRTGATASPGGRPR